MNSQLKMVCGLIFNQDFTQILLISKNSPIYLKNKLNGIGGKLEVNETSLQAMMRECQEESGLIIEAKQWCHLGHFNNLSYELDWFYCTLENSHFDQYHSLTDEIVAKYKVEEILNDSLCLAPGVIYFTYQSLLQNKKTALHKN